MNFQGIGYFQNFARYNSWANVRLYKACLDLPDKEYEKDGRAYFGSIGNTFNHILVGDRIWLSRFTGEKAEIMRLDAVPYVDRNELWAQRQKQDSSIIDLFDDYDDEILTGKFIYYDTDNVQQSIPVQMGFGQFFNHQTHHRGQIHNILSVIGVEPPPLDFSYFCFDTLGS